jgi:hypothetical protein
MHSAYTNLSITTLDAEYYYVQCCCYAECHVFNVLQRAVMLSIEAFVTCNTFGNKTKCFNSLKTVTETVSFGTALA